LACHPCHPCHPRQEKQSQQRRGGFGSEEVLALSPFPLVILAGMTILIIWRFHRRDLLGKNG
jgi:hypothetical protein